MGSAAFDYSVYCDRCGEAYAPKKPVCAGCGWLPMIGLGRRDLLP